MNNLKYAYRCLECDYYFEQDSEIVDIFNTECPNCGYSFLHFESEIVYHNVEPYIYQWDESLDLEEQKNGAYWERNMLALRFADGWYYDTENNWEGWKRVLSLDDGRMNFHIPDNFDVGDLKEIKNNWDGHTTKEKWLRVMKIRGIIK